MAIKFSNFEFWSDRDELIESLCAGKRTLHIGACDSPYTQQKFDAGLLLHERLGNCTEDLMGIDIDADGVLLLKKLGFENVVRADVAQYSVEDEYPEVLVFGETIEHLENPGEFLTALKNIMNEDSSLLVTTPNLLSLGFQFMVLTNQEQIHPEHLIGFSPALLLQLLEQLGFEVTGLYFTFLPRESEGWRKSVWRTMCKLRPGWAETIVVTAKLKS